MNKQQLDNLDKMLPQDWQSTSDNEIDLRELLLVLWRQRVQILLITAAFAIAGTGYALLAPQVWVSEAQIKPPALQEVESLELSVNQLINSQIPAAVFSSFDKGALYGDFVNNFNSFNNKRQFLREKGYLDIDAVASGITEDKGKRVLLRKMVEGINAMSQDTSSGNVTLSFGASTAVEAKQRLEQYIAFIQQQEIATKSKELETIWHNRIKILLAQYDSIKTDTLQQQQDDVSRTEYSLRISRAAGIDSPVENLNVRDGFNIEWGARALAEKLKVLKEINNPELLNPVLSGLRQQLSSLKAVKLGQQSFQSFAYSASPNEPLSRDQPKRPLIVVLTTLLGGMLGIGIVLVRYSFRRPEQV
ncbi:Wzz/FepE/Etk N-terminal domain-containing protein [Aeromonas piscicola]|uniref:Wzz/FepE/Etk N-terminal domain-containing protein n=1 Tax=Aeromonas piscicola TaxID=600645 RepID=A0ABT7QDH1_9GAMM|nr:Wzz/FepE/Etk N-terminal domain-containing protein [Aeromonas piscicola]MDM5131994.1 Wzz/FepE/Etk N-terminal domain-containing protein [Aeromonas piscicola]